MSPSLPDFPAAMPEVAGELAEQRSRVAALEVEVAELHMKIDRLSSTKQIVQTVGDSDPNLADVLALTREMFAGEPIVEVLHDPENPQVPLVTVTVSWSGEPRELIQKRLAWHQRVAQICPGRTLSIRLSVIPC